MAQFRGDDLFDDSGGVVVREVAVPAQDALLDAPGPFGVRLEQFQVMIGFEQQHVRDADAFDDEIRGVAEVSQETDVARAGANQETDRIVGIVRHGEGVHDDIAHFKCCARAENPAVESGVELIFNRLLGEAVAEDRNPELRAQHCQTLNMIAVFVRDEDAVQPLRRAAYGGKPPPDLTAAQTGVDEQPRLVCFEVSAIAGRAAAQDRQVDRHRPTLIARRPRPQPFCTHQPRRRRGEQDKFKNRRKRRGRRGNEAEVFFALKSACSRRRLPCLNTPCVTQVRESFRLTSRRNGAGTFPVKAEIVPQKA